MNYKEHQSLENSHAKLPAIPFHPLQCVGALKGIYRKEASWHGIYKEHYYASAILISLILVHAAFISLAMIDIGYKD